jgi:hypothetical protein
MHLLRISTLSYGQEAGRLECTKRYEDAPQFGVCDVRVGGIWCPGGRRAMGAKGNSLWLVQE